jgi:hypothetical protein
MPSLIIPSFDPATLAGGCPVPGIVSPRTRQKVRHLRNQKTSDSQ